MVPREVLMKSGLVSVNTARQDKNVNAARPKVVVNAARPKAIVNVVKGNNVNDVKASACWVWKPKTKVLDHVSKHNSASITLKKFDYGNPQVDLQDQGVIDSGCSRHMTGNMSYLTNYKEIDKGYVTFGGNPKGGKIRRKCTIKTGNLDFENLIDESQVLLRVPRKKNMYSVDLKNIVPKRVLTCLFAKATSDESKLWHRRLGHLNFKTMNKFVKGNLVRGLPSKLFENDETYVACQKGKQHRASYTNGVIKVLSPKTAEEILARERERKASTTLLMALPKDHLAKFHKITDVKEMWEAIKSRFGGNDESKKMQKYILKQQFEGFSVSNSKGLHKGYDRSLPSAWSQVSLIMRTKPRVDSLSFDDLYNNLRVFESDVKGSTASSSSTQNVAFVSENTSSTNEVSTAYGASSSSGHNP
ncbi:ribonuclease H-like domain-containing protein [Tanacetum coccineum]